MKNPVLLTINGRIDRFLSYDGITEDALQLKKNVWFGDILVGSATNGMTLPAGPDDEKPILLIVEDNADLEDYLILVPQFIHSQL